MSAPPLLLGREAELDRLRVVLLGATPAAAVIIGESGQGKTALAHCVFLDDAIVQRFGDRRYWADLTGARTECDGLAVLAGALQVSSGAALKPRIVEQLAEGPALLVLEGVAIGEGSDIVSMDELAATLAGIQTLAWVVTSRRLREAFSVRWKEIVELAPLDAAQAKRAFLAHAGSRFEGDARLDELIEAFDRVPGALELLARQVARDATLEPLWDRWQRSELAAPAGGADRVAERATARAVALVLRSPDLSPGARTLLSAVARLPDGLARDDLQVLPGVTPDAPEALVALGMADPLRERCRIVPALAEHARRLLPPDAPLLGALDDLYMGLVERLAPHAGTAGGDEAMARLAPEVRNIESVLVRGLEHRGARAAGAAYAYGNFIRHSGVGDSGLLDRARDVARDGGNPRLAADCALRSGDIALGRFDHPRAQQRCEEALGEYRSIGDYSGEAQCLRNLGVIALRTQRWTAAEAFFEQSIAAARRGGDAFAEAVGVERLGDVAFSRGLSDRAQGLFEDALARYRALAHPREADCWLSLGQLALRTDAVRAREYTQKALDLHRSAAHWLGVANSVMFLAQMDGVTDPNGAERMFREALAIYRRLGNVRGEANTRVLLADLATRAGNVVKASRLAREALSLYRSVSDVHGESVALAALAEVAEAEGRTVEAAAFRKESDALFAQSQGPR